MNHNHDLSICAMEQHQCPVCLAIFETGGLLIAKNINKGFAERHALTGHSFCPEHQKLSDEGFIALAELTREPRRGEEPLSVPRTGVIAHVKESAWPHIFSVPVPPNRLCLVEVGVIDKLKGGVASEQEGGAA
ncbi:hypothetical protein UFOVP708_27 [uncultured Caudovirales phage]|uniref:Uncharacterized protein n=1 Tax=uncultured Caudovirales phage TaxID=2100421 RepID=A0A6J5NPC0_9CAUD|nr:hypothetical protein UFOVP708_27 [uncultured Caudovirales phage]